MTANNDIFYEINKCKSQNWPSCIFGRIEVMEIMTQRIMLKLTKNLCRPQSGCKTPHKRYVKKKQQEWCQNWALKQNQWKHNSATQKTENGTNEMQDDLQQQLHCVSKNVPHLTCYNLDIHNPFVIMFGRSVTEKARNQTMLCFLTSPISNSALSCKTGNPER